MSPTGAYPADALSVRIRHGAPRSDVIAGTQRCRTEACAAVVLPRVCVWLALLIRKRFFLVVFIVEISRTVSQDRWDLHTTPGTAALPLTQNRYHRYIDIVLQVMLEFALHGHAGSARARYKWLACPRRTEADFLATSSEVIGACWRAYACGRS